MIHILLADLFIIFVLIYIHIILYTILHPNLDYITQMYNKIFPIYISEIKLHENLQLEKNYDLVIKNAPRTLSLNEKKYLLQYKKFVDLPNVYSMCGLADINQIKFLLENIINDHIDGCIVETGVWRGGMSMWMQSILKYHNNKRDIWLFDTFGTFPSSSNSKDKYIHSITSILFANAPTIADVKNNFRMHDLLDTNIKFVVGDFKDSIPHSQVQDIALLHCDSDYYDSTKIVLEIFYWKIVKGGYIVIDDYNNIHLGCKDAVDDFRRKYSIKIPIIDTHHGSVYWRI